MKVENIGNINMENVIPLLKRCYDEMEYVGSGYGFDPETIKKAILGNIQGGGINIMVVDKGDIVGIAVVFFLPSFLNASDILAIEAAWHSDPKLNQTPRVRIMLLLLREMEERVREHKVRTLHLATSVLYPAIANKLRKNDYKLMEYRWVKEVYNGH